MKPDNDQSKPPELKVNTFMGYPIVYVDSLSDEAAKLWIQSMDSVRVVQKEDGQWEIETAAPSN